MYSVILSGNEKKTASRLHREGVIMAGKIKNQQTFNKCSSRKRKDHIYTQ